MTLNFPNQSRNYDRLRRLVRFWGNDGVFEICFFVGPDALRSLDPATPGDEAGLLGAFDKNRKKIAEAASRVYARRRRDAYTLSATDF